MVMSYDADAALEILNDIPEPGENTEEQEI